MCAFVSALVRFNERSQLFYQCQISITIKEPNTECARPQCAEPQGFGASKEQQLPEELRMISAMMVMPNGICLSPFGFSVFVAAAVSLIAASVVLASYSLRSRSNFKV
ncbi:hypothetical protein NECAME_05502 [Necator americanus]|uniref:Cuticlin C-terminal domain-containing protein n=1 Tax=Necator americanus TaxID=51031 RepID=W2SIT1_NECAM|nr:hypothetical protein NECAME_05502 [Necator americanus]ETN68657.1 hypothetical protein NECAME_05502 [Necator americanus]